MAVLQLRQVSPLIVPQCKLSHISARKQIAEIAPDFFDDALVALQRLARVVCVIVVGVDASEAAVQVCEAVAVLRVVAVADDEFGERQAVRATLKTFDCYHVVRRKCSGNTHRVARTQVAELAHDDVDQDACVVRVQQTGSVVRGVDVTQELGD